MRNGIALILVLLLASGAWFVRRAFPKAPDLLEETHASAMDTNPPAMPATPAASDTKPPDNGAASPPPPPPADTQPADQAPQTIPVTDAIRVTDTVTNVTEVPNMMDDASSRQDQNVFYKIRLGYEYNHYGRGNSTWHAGAQFNVRPSAWYGQSPSIWQTLLIPDITAEIGHAGIATGVNGTPTVGDGVRTDLSLFWPWLNWNAGKAGTDMAAGTPPKKKFSFGPALYGDYQELTSIDIARPEWARYGGARLMMNHDAYLEYTVGKTDGLPGLRYQLTGEFPLYQKDGSDLRYVVHGMWNSSYNSQKDDYGISLMVEFPFDAIEHPSKFRDLVPFVQ